MILVIIERIFVRGKGEFIPTKNERKSTLSKLHNIKFVAGEHHYIPHRIPCPESAIILVEERTLSAWKEISESPLAGQVITI